MYLPFKVRRLLIFIFLIILVYVPPVYSPSTWLKLMDSNHYLTVLETAVLPLN
nr:MAG TPA: hypothetical protein [Caudoviricetes sp.]